MRRIIVTVKLKDILVGIIIFNLCIILLSMIFVGVNKGKSKVDIDTKKQIQKDNKTENKGLLNKSIEPKINVYLKKEDRVITLDLEEYIVGVVSAEMPANFHEEALKAQAVAARTYAVAHIKSVSGKGCNLHKDADICDSVHCQAYIDKDKRLQSWPEKDREALYKKVRTAVESTSGQVLSYDGDLVMTPYYFATSSGKTENAQEVFGSDKPYLKSVESKGEEIAPKYEKEFKVSSDKFIKLIKGKFKDLNISIGEVNNKINILERSEGGSVKTIKIGNITTTGKTVRSLLGLTSANFEIGFSGNDIVFKCKGYGHGVGMSQWGAGVMAKEGKSYEDILKHYYTGIEIVKIK